MAIKKTIPSNPFSETIVLSACMSSIDALNESADRLQPDAFYHGKNPSIFEACKRLYLENKTVDPYVIIAELKNSINPEEANDILVMRDYHEPEVGLREHIDNIARCWQQRKLHFSALKMADDILTSDPHPDELVEKYVTAHTNIVAGNVNGSREMQDVLDSFSKGLTFEEFIEEKKTRANAGLDPYQGVRSYFPRLDETLGAFQNGCLHYLGARTSMGKTTFLLNIVKNIVRNEPDTPIAFLSLEMLASTIVVKMLCMIANVTFKDYTSARLNDEQYHRLIESGRDLRGKLYIDDESMDISRLCARCRRLVHVEGVKIIFIDYLTCIRATDKLNTNHERVNQVSKGLLALSKELNVPIVCLAQLNRGLTARVDKSPTLSDFRESGSIEEDADVCMLLHRPAYYDDTHDDKTTHLIIAKNRLMGELGKIKYDWCDKRPGIYTEQDSFDQMKSSEMNQKKDKNNEWKPYRDW